MKTLSKNSKIAKHYLMLYLYSSKESLRECYKTCSQEKQKSEQFCFHKMLESGGKNFRILSYNTFQFTCGWKLGKDLRVETAANSYLIKEAFND